MSYITDGDFPPLTGDGRDGFPAKVEFNIQMEDYLLGLNPKKRAKALMTEDMYSTILSVLLEPQSTAFATAQFRFWSKRMFRLVSTPHANIVTHENRPVAVKDQIYSILVGCHGDAGHGGRDKTSAQVRRFYSWIPKELVSRFVKMCPACIAKRRSQKQYFSDTLQDGEVDLPPPVPTASSASSHITSGVCAGVPDSPPDDLHLHASTSQRPATYIPYAYPALETSLGLSAPRPQRGHSLDSVASTSSFDSSSFESSSQYAASVDNEPIQLSFDQLGHFYLSEAGNSGLAAPFEFDQTQLAESLAHWNAADSQDVYDSLLASTEPRSSVSETFQFSQSMPYDETLQFRYEQGESALYEVQDHAGPSHSEGSPDEEDSSNTELYYESQEYQDASYLDPSQSQNGDATSASQELHFRRGVPKPPPLDLGRASNLYPSFDMLRLSSAGAGPSQPEQQTYDPRNDGPYSAPLQAHHLQAYRSIYPLASPLSACSTASLSSNGYSMPLTPSNSQSLYDVPESMSSPNWQQTSKDLALAIQTLLDSGADGMSAPPGVQVFDPHQVELSHLQQQHVINHEARYPIEDDFVFTGSNVARERERTRTRTMSAGFLQKGSPGMYTSSVSPERRGSASYVLEGGEKSALRTPRREERFAPY